MSPGPTWKKPSRNTVRLEPFCATRREATAGPVLMLETSDAVDVMATSATDPTDVSHCSVGTDSLTSDDGTFSCPRTEEKVQILFSRNDSGVTIAIAISWPQ